MDPTCSTTSAPRVISDTHDALGLESIQGLLFKRVNYTSTAMGARRLRSELLSPPTDIITIGQRLDFTEQYRGKPIVAHLQKILRTFPDTSRILKLLSAFLESGQALPQGISIECPEATLNAPYRLSDYAKYLSLVKDLSSMHAGLKQLVDCPISTIQDLFLVPEWGHTSRILEGFISPRYASTAPSIFVGDTQFVAPKIDECLDLARSIYRKNVAECQELLIRLSGGQSLSIYHDAFHGACLLAACRDSSPFIPLRMIKRGTVCTTPELQNINHRIREVFEQIVELEGRLCLNLLRQDGAAQVFHKLVSLVNDRITDLDILLSNAAYSQKPDAIRPIFADGTSLVRAIHPLLSSPVPNNYFFNLKLSFMLITGENTSGKSTYAKGLVYSQILAQIGCFIRAELAQFILMKKLEYVKSMADIERVVMNDSAPTHVIIDELEIPLAVQLGFSEWLIARNVFCFYVTHRHELIKYLKCYSNINALRLSRHVAESGVNEDVNALELIRSNLPGSIYERSLEYFSMMLPSRTEYDNSLIQAAVLIENGNDSVRKKLKLELQKKYSDIS